MLIPDSIPDVDSQGNYTPRAEIEFFKRIGTHMNELMNSFGFKENKMLTRLSYTDFDGIKFFNNTEFEADPSTATLLSSAGNYETLDTSSVPAN